MPGHFENAIETIGGVFSEHFGDIILKGVENEVGSGVDAELGAVGRDFGGEDVFRAEAFADCDGKESDGAEAGDKDVFTFDGAIHNGVHRIAKGIQHGGDIFGHALRHGACVHRGNDGVGGESTIDIDTEELGGAIDVSEAAEVIGGIGVNNVRFGGDKIADLSVRNVVGDFDDGAAEFVSDDADGFDTIA